MQYIESPIFYMGNKIRLLPQLKPMFPKEIDTFYDLFGGSGVVSLNVNANKIIYNELNENIYELFNLFSKYSYQEIIEHLEKRVYEFGLLEQEENNYYNFRNFYNKSSRNYLDLYTLTFFSFSNLIRFNSKNDFNMPVGNRFFTEIHKKRISYACHRNLKTDIETKNEDALKYIEKNLDKFKQEDFIYLDPPYLNTLAVYNEKRAFGGWNIEHDYKLFELLEKLNEKGIKWGLSNVFHNKGNTNQHLIDWCIKNNWNINHLECEYTSLGKGNSDTDEVYICNYPTDKQTTIFDFLEEEK